MNFSILKDLNQVRQYENRWRSAIKNQGICCPFAGYDWITEYCKQILSSRNIFIGIYNEQDKFVMLPFYFENGEISLIGDRFFDYKDAIAQSNDIPDIASFLVNTKAHTIRLSNLREDALLYSLTKFNKDNNFLIIEKDLFNSPYLKIEGNNWEGYYNNLSRNSRDIIKRRIKKLASLGQVSFGYCKNRRELDEVINIMYEQHIKRRESLGQNKSLFLNSRNRIFFNTVCEKLFLDSNLYMFYLKLDEKIIATAFCFLGNDVLYYYIPTFDCGYKDCSPGRILLFNIIKFSFDSEFREFDFMIGEEDYKLHWNAELRKIREVVLFRRNLKGTISLVATSVFFAWEAILRLLGKTKLRTIKRTTLRIFYKTSKK